jgi:hypothetical protein
MPKGQRQDLDPVLEHLLYQPKPANDQRRTMLIAKLPLPVHWPPERQPPTLRIDMGTIHDSQEHRMFSATQVGSYKRILPRMIGEFLARVMPPQQLVWRTRLSKSDTIRLRLPT